jgi:hypothetical protein
MSALPGHTDQRSRRGQVAFISIDRTKAVIC